MIAEDAPPILRLGRTCWVEGTLPVLLVNRLDEGLVTVDTGLNRLTLPEVILTAEPTPSPAARAAGGPGG